ncbi:MAG: O-antigen ligase family protein [Janthinobacterium lividum]
MKQKFAEGLLLSAVCVLAFAVMFGHFTGVKNIALACAVLGLLALAVVRKRRPVDAHYAPWPQADLLVPLGLWMAWTAASLAWSVFPAASAAAWVDEVAIPTLGFFAFYRIGSIGRPVASAAGVRSGKTRTRATAKGTRAAPAPAALAARPEDLDQADRPYYAVAFETSCWLAAFLLAALSLYGVGQLDPEMPKPGLLHFYERVGHTSTFAVAVLPLFIALCARAATRLAGISGILLALLIGLLSLNRFFEISAIVTLLIGFSPALRRRRLAGALTVVVLLVVGTAAVLYSTAERRPAVAGAVVPTAMQQLERAVDVDRWKVSLSRMVDNDTRPMVWRAYAELGMQHPWIGVGFGKPLPAYAYAESLPPSLVILEPHAKTHAHDLFLNTWLQVGVIGLVLQLLLLIALIRAFMRTAAADVWLRAAGVALVCGVICKNLTDDFLWQSTSLAFWGQAGWLLGRARLSGMVRYRLASGRSVAMRRLRRVGN